MQCPQCQLDNPPRAQRCDCGYNFQAGSSEPQVDSTRQANRSVGSKRQANSHVDYDARIIEGFAIKLYQRARSLVVAYLLTGAVVGASIAALAATSEMRAIGAIIGLFGGATIGFFLGQQLAFGLKLQAQVALCQVQIEKNTRIAASVSRDMKAGPANANAA